MIKPRELVIAELHKRNLRLTYGPADIWDMVPAQLGITVIMLDGSVHPLPMSQGAARQVLHSWSVETKA